MSFTRPVLIVIDISKIITSTFKFATIIMEFK